MLQECRRIAAGVHERCCSRASQYASDIRCTATTGVVVMQLAQALDHVNHDRDGVTALDSACLCGEAIPSRSTPQHSGRLSVMRFVKMTMQRLP